MEPQEEEKKKTCKYRKPISKVEQSKMKYFCPSKVHAKIDCFLTTFWYVHARNLMDHTVWIHHKSVSLSSKTQPRLGNCCLFGKGDPQRASVRTLLTFGTIDLYVRLALIELFAVSGFWLCDAFIARGFRWKEWIGSVKSRLLDLTSKDNWLEACLYVFFLQNPYSWLQIKLSDEKLMNLMKVECSHKRHSYSGRHTKSNPLKASSFIYIAENVEQRCRAINSSRSREWARHFFIIGQSIFNKKCHGSRSL